MNAAVTKEMRAAYAEADHGQRVRISRIGCVLALILVPLFWGLDWFVYPDQAWSLLGIRLVCNALIAVVLGLLFLPVAGRHVRVLGIAWAVVPAAAIAWMIYITEGWMSPYYAGLNLAMIIVCLLMPWTFTEVVVLCGLVIGLYLAACGFHSGTDAATTPTLINNLYFMLATATICCMSGFFAAQRRFSEFRLRYELDEKNKQMEELDRLKSNFFANVSHELRTPLTLILGPVDNLLHSESRSDEFVVRQLKTVRSNGLRLLKLINDLLDLIRLDSNNETGRQAESHKPVDVAKMADAMASSIRHTTDEKGLHLVTSGVAESIYVMGDDTSLERMLLNLLTNATKFTPPGGQIEVIWNREDDDAVLRVRDTGVGIPKDELPFVFDRFRQVDSSSTRRYQGLGLGLALVHDIVEEHGGTIAVSSEVGRGTSFEIRLPIVQPFVDGEQPRAAVEYDTQDPLVKMHQLAARHGLEEQGGMQPDIPAPAFKPGVGRILIVDDEPSMQRYLTDTLRDDYNLLHAADGPAGLQIARSQVPDLILLDLMLPGIDGLEICRQLREDKSMADTRIILLTARVDESSKLTALDHGADDFLNKPFSSIELKTRIRNLLRTSTLQRELRDRNQQLEQAIRDLASARSQLMQSEKMNALGSLAAGLLHEINNPLNYAMAALQLSMGDPDAMPPNLRETLMDVHDGINRVQDIIVDLRSFAHPEHSACLTHVDFDDVVTTALRFTASETGHIEFAIFIPDGIYIEGNRNQIIQVLVNLFTNAGRATLSTKDQRPARVEVSCQDNGDSLHLCIRDNGIGIASERLQRIFEPFFTTSDVGGGLGLGLSICHTIVTKHGGSISIRSEAGAWTEVLIDLPHQQRVTTDHEIANPN